MMVLSGCLYQAAHNSHDKDPGMCIPWWRHRDREQRHHCPRDITWHVGGVGGSGHFHLLLYSTYQMILIKYVHSRPWPICSKFIDNQDDDCCINSVASAFLLLLNLTSIFYKFHNDIFVKLNKAILKLKTKCSHVNKDKEKLLPFPYGSLHLQRCHERIDKNRQTWTCGIKYAWT